MSIKNMFKKIYIYNQLKYNQRRLHRYHSTNPFKPVRPVLTLHVCQVTAQPNKQRKAKHRHLTRRTTRSWLRTNYENITQLNYHKLVYNLTKQELIATLIIR